MGDGIEQNETNLREDMQFQAFDLNLSMAWGHNIPLNSNFGQLTMTSPARDSLVPNNNYPSIPQPTYEKFKASNFPIMSIKIGSWEKYSRYPGELVAKYYYAKKKIIWEFLDGALKNKIEIQFSDVEAIRATINETQPETLEILLWKPPMFFRETNPIPKRHTIWHDSLDFTGGQATSYRIHYVTFPPGALNGHYAKLLQSDSRLLNVSEKPFPIFDCPYFQTNIFDTSNISVGNGILPRMFPSQVDYNVQMMRQNSIHAQGTQSPNLGVYYQQRNHIIDQTRGPFYESSSGVSNMLSMNGRMQSMPSGAPNIVPMYAQMQAMPNVIFSMQDQENVLHSETSDEIDEILRNIEEHLLGD